MFSSRLATARQRILGCGDSNTSRLPLGPSPSATAPAPPPPSNDLLVFTDRDGFHISDVRDSDEQIVQFTTGGGLIWVADGMRFSGYRFSADPTFGYILAPRVCAVCAYEIRFGAKDGERRAILRLTGARIIQAPW